ncbi:MAG: ATP--guanido phosphotransferase [Oscillospiraceae bacterium]|jgi:protein arginine kinase|nr:ATP--guanido phosphotransferase [Oscillospiraceae bacterium]
MPEAYENQNDIVLSTRVRLARNLAEYPFPARLDIKGRQKVCEAAHAAALAIAPELEYIDMAELSRAKAVSLAERRLCSAAFAQRDQGGALLLRKDCRVSVMLCEEDHIRLQAYAPGLALREAWELADSVDTAFSRKLNFAFSEQLGYLTQCPTNLGTAMRASVLLHLPALARLGRVGRLAESISKLGLTIRGAFGEGSDAEGALFQLSNQVTLGITEQAALENLQAITLQIAEQERLAQRELLKDPAIENKVWRALGLLRYARRLDSKEALQLLSLAALGACGGALELPLDAIYQLMTDVLPATLSLDPAAAGDRDAARATLIRERLKAES